MIENIEIFNFKLTQEDISMLEKLDEDKSEDLQIVEFAMS